MILESLGGDAGMTELENKYSMFLGSPPPQASHQSTSIVFEDTYSRLTTSDDREGTWSRIAGQQFLNGSATYPPFVCLTPQRQDYLTGTQHIRRLLQGP